MDLVLANEALIKYFGYKEFRPMQADIIQAVYDKKNVLVLMPTGGGKSICYQIPAVTLPGICIVVSPLISLMKDQVESLKANGIKAAFLNSSLSSAEQQAVEDDMYNGELKLLYVSPERMVSQSFMPLLKQANISLFAIDEAHCISAWGHDFRKEYTQLAFLTKQFKGVPVIALTATADKMTRKDIVKQLRLNNPEVFISSFDRPNISLSVRPGTKRLEQIVDFIKERPNQSGIIYCLSRKNTETVSAGLNKRGIKSAFYHAGIADRDRASVQESFINDNVPIVCATVAFGMGIDKSNVRWVIHYNLPQNMEGFYQEIGRAGRDGAKSDTLLFYSYGDVMILREILSNKENENIDLRLSKLERIQQYAESLICRRKILLNYFGENLEKDCGNCDVCKNPPQYFNGTVIVQKALSAITRLKQRVGTRLLIDVLRGSSRAEILNRGYDKIKTYGAGADISAIDWQYLIMQMINMGYLEIAYDQNNVLRLTEASKEVLFGKKQVQLVKMQAIKARKAAQKTKDKKVNQRQRVRDELFEVLRSLRKKLAQKRGVPPYIVFSDKTLEEMAAERPINSEQMRKISGVGEQKLNLYGEVFINAILEFMQSQAPTGAKAKVSTYALTHQLYRQGLTVDQIAEKRALNIDTIYSHLAHLYEHGENIKLNSFVSKKEVTQVLQILETMEEPFKLKAIYDQLNESIPYHKIRLAISYYKKNIGV